MLSTTTMKPIKMVPAILGFLSADLVHASPIAHLLKAANNHNGATVPAQVMVHEAANDNSTTRDSIRALSKTEDQLTPILPMESVEYPSGSSDPNEGEMAADAIIVSQTSENSTDSLAANGTNVDERGNVIADLFGFGVEDTIEDVMRPKPHKGQCYYRDIPRTGGFAVTREYTVGIDMPFEDIPELCGGLWDNLQFKACTVDFVPHCKAYKGKHYSGLNWFFVTMNSCQTASIPETFLEATGGKAGIIEDCVPAPAKSEAVSDFPHRSLEEEE